MGTHLRVLSESFPMNTNMTGFRGFSKSLGPCTLGQVSGLSIGRVKSLLVGFYLHNQKKHVDDPIAQLKVNSTMLPSIGDIMLCRSFCVTSKGLPAGFYLLIAKKTCFLHHPIPHLKVNLSYYQFSYVILLCRCRSKGLPVGFY